MTAADLNGTEVARRVGVSQQTVSDWSLGSTLPSLRRLDAIAQALGVHPDAVREAILDDKVDRENAERRGERPVPEPNRSELEDRVTQIESTLTEIRSAQQAIRSELEQVSAEVSALVDRLTREARQAR